MFNKNWNTFRALPILCMPKSIDDKNIMDLSMTDGFTNKDNITVYSFWPAECPPDFKYLTLFYSQNSFVNSISNSANDSKIYNIGEPGLAGWMLNIGSGITPPTDIDFDLENGYLIKTNYNQLNLEVSHNIDTEAHKSIYIITGRYVAITDMNINEMGLSSGLSIKCYKTGYGYQYSVGNTCRYLFAREILPSTMNVSAGEGFTLQMKIEFPY